MIFLLVGRGIVGVTVMVAIVVFFPALVMIMVGLRAAPAQAQDLIAAYGGSRWTALRMVSVPSALPAVFAAARVSVPGALIGALIGEWLGSGQGLGSSMIKAIPRYQYNELWASIVVITVVRSEEHTSELQSLMRISYAVFCLKKKKINRIKY